MASVVFSQVDKREQLEDDGPPKFLELQAMRFRRPAEPLGEDALTASGPSFSHPENGPPPNSSRPLLRRFVGRRVDDGSTILVSCDYGRKCRRPSYTIREGPDVFHAKCSCHFANRSLYLCPVCRGRLSVTRPWYISLLAILFFPCMCFIIQWGKRVKCFRCGHVIRVL